MFTAVASFRMVVCYQLLYHLEWYYVISYCII